MLKEIIERNHYTFEEGFDNWEDAIRAGYKPLLADNTVEDIYVQAVIDCVKKFGPLYRDCTKHRHASFYGRGSGM